MPSTSSVDAVVDFVCQAATELESSSKVYHCFTFEMCEFILVIGFTVHLVCIVKKRLELARLKRSLGTLSGWHCERIFESEN